MHDDTIEIRQPTADPETLRAFLQPVAVAFGDDYTDEMFELDRQLFELDRLIGAVDGDTWVAGATRRVEAADRPGRCGRSRRRPSAASACCPPIVGAAILTR